MATSVLKGLLEKKMAISEINKATKNGSMPLRQAVSAGLSRREEVDQRSRSEQ
jgi:hypothetical protein